MFTGIVEFTGTIISIEHHGSNKTFWIESDISPELQVDQSVSHNGVCLTIEDVQNRMHKVTAIKETVDKTDIGDWEPLQLVNLERSMIMNGRIDGHIVQGHVDGTAACIEKQEMNGSVEFTFKFDQKFAPLVIEKGSICINGVSLTAFGVKKKKFTVAIIPYTFTHTNFSALQEGAKVNVEFDMIGKYVRRLLETHKK